MKFNWGHGITVFFSIFVIIMLGVLYLSRQENIDLVTEDYYGAELKYQDKIDEFNNSKEKGFEVSHSKRNENLVLLFPEELKNGSSLNGEVYFYRPSDAAFDYTQSIVLNPEAELIVETSKLIAGYYIMKISFTFEEIPYYIEKAVMI